MLVAKMKENQNQFLNAGNMFCLGEYNRIWDFCVKTQRLKLQILVLGVGIIKS